MTATFLFEVDVYNMTIRDNRVKHEWKVYIIRCSDGSLYTGVTKDVGRRVIEHNVSDVLAAKYTRARRPVMLVYQEEWGTRSQAGKREHEIKRMTKKAKETLILASQ